MVKLFNLLQNISNVIKAYCKIEKDISNILICTPEDYNISKHSFFLDIGSMYGKTVFHAAFQVGCESKGIEAMPSRVEFCIDFYYENICSQIFFKEIDAKFPDENNESKNKKLFSVPTKFMNINFRLFITKTRGCSLHLCHSRRRFL